MARAQFVSSVKIVRELIQSLLPQVMFPTDVMSELNVDGRDAMSVAISSENPMTE